MQLGIGFLALRLELAASEAGLTSLDVAHKLGCSYEHVRKLFRGCALPSKWFLKDLCKLLRIDRAEAERLLRSDFCRLHYRSSYWTLRGLRPENDEFHVLWYFLRPNEREMFMHQMRWCIALRERKGGN